MTFYLKDMTPADKKCLSPGRLIIIRNMLFSLPTSNIPPLPMEGEFPGPWQLIKVRFRFLFDSEIKGEISLNEQ